MKISATEFKAQCLSLMDQVHEKREVILITKHGKPIAKLVPADRPFEIHSPIGFLKGKVTIKEDIVKPLGVDWGF
jgi:prevent-host-death family protein